MSREVRQYTWLRISVLSIGAIMFFVSAITLSRLWPIVHQGLTARTYACGCALMAVQTSWWIVLLSTLMAAGIIVSWSLFAWHMVRHLWRHRRHQHNIQRLTAQRVEHQTGVSYNLVDTTEPIAETTGFLQPQITVSTELVRRLSGSELTAVLHHEFHHQRSYDPLVTMLLDCVAAGLKIIPGTSSWMPLAYSLRELAADAYATNNYESADALSSAFLKLSDLLPSRVGIAFSPNRDRVEKLLNHSWTTNRRWWSWSTVTMGAIILTGMLWLSGQARAAGPALPAGAAAACHRTIVMCEAERFSSAPAPVLCGQGRCLMADHPFTPAYVITLEQ